jgi:DNA-binding NtrC family response regulator
MHGDPAVFDRVFTPLVWSALRERPWPGNVRDLVHVVGRALLFVASLGPEAASEHILENAGQQWHSSLATPDAVPESRFAENLAPFSRSQRRSERTAADFAWALRAANGDIPETARLLGISRSHAYRLYKALRRN